MLLIKLTSVMVDDQARAEKFYTEVLGFQIKQDFPVGEYKWLTVVSPAEPTGTELLLEPNSGLPEAAAFQKAVYAAGMPAVSFAVDDIRAEYARLKSLGVAFLSEPTSPEFGPLTVILDDTCGNHLMLFQA